MIRIRQWGFTIVELVVIITVIGILATIGTLGLSQYQAESRDAIRDSKAHVIAEALEKYYDTYGEYPSCQQLTQSPQLVRKDVLVNISLDALKTPRGAENSLACTDLSDTSGDDIFAYVGDGSATCIGPSGNACAIFTLKYLKESTGSVETIASRRQIPLDPNAIPTLTVAPTGLSSINATWSTISQATSYQLQYSKTTTFPTTEAENTANSGTLSSTTNSKAITGLSTATIYYFRVRAVSYSPGNWSETKTASTWSLIPPTVSCGSATTTSIQCSWAAIAGASSYQFQTRINNGSWSATSSQTAISRTITNSTQGTRIDIRVQTVFGSGEVSDWSTIAGANLTIVAPVLNTIGRTISYPNIATRYYNSANTSSCPTGTQLQNRYRNGTSPSTWGAWTSWENSSSTTSTSTFTINFPSYTDTFQIEIEGRCINTASGIASSSTSSGVSTAKHTPPTITLSPATYCAGAYSGRSAFHLRLGVQEVSYNFAANTSVVSWTLYRYAATGGWQSFDATKTWPWSANVNGSGWSGASNSTTWRYAPSVAGQTEIIASSSVTVTHNAAGNATISYSGSDGPGSAIFGSASCSGSYNLSDLRP